MFTLYSVLLTAAFVILSPRFLLDALRHGKYSAGFRERMGHLPAFDSEGAPVIWLHCVSVGETQAARPLVDELLKNFPGHKLVISTITDTGQEVARRLFADKAALIFYFPFDWKFSVRRALKAIKPQAVLLMETELWFNFLREAHKSGASVAIVNGRLSQRSVGRYSWIPKFMHRIFHYVDLALMQSQGDAGRIRNIGMRNPRIRVTGNIKFDQGLDDNESLLTREFRRRFGISADAPLIAAVSTHQPEEKLVLEAFAAIKESPENNRARLLIAPRHPERFDEVAALISAAGFASVRRTASPGIADGLADVILLDSIGELRAVLPLSEIVFVGGSLIPHGGQNILEPAAARKAIVTGHYTMNFAAIVEEFLAKEALIRLPKLEEHEIAASLAAVFTQVLEDRELRGRLAENAFSLMLVNSGAAAKTVNYLKPILEKVSAGL
jgi:3-deoxy-D-manno-octulosonic-acid transferase